MKRIALLFVATFFAFSSFAISIHAGLGEPTYVGSGCPHGHASVVLSSDGTELSILFDQYVVDAGGNAGVSTARKHCDFAVPVLVPPGISITVTKIDYRGFNDLPYGAYARFATEYFFAGGRGPRFERTFTGPVYETYDLSDSADETETTWSQCGRSVILRSTSNMLVTSPSLQHAESRVDADDTSPGLIYHLQYRPC